MGILKKIMDNVNHKKCEKALTKVHNMIKYQNQIIITLPTTKGYDEFFQQLIAEQLEFKIDDSFRDNVFVTIEKRERKQFII